MDAVKTVRTEQSSRAEFRLDIIMPTAKIPESVRYGYDNLLAEHRRNLSCREVSAVGCGSDLA
jgi:hypothetical protein